MKFFCMIRLPPMGLAVLKQNKLFLSFAIGDCFQFLLYFVYMSVTYSSCTPRIFSIDWYPVSSAFCSRTPFCSGRHTYSAGFVGCQSACSSFFL